MHALVMKASFRVSRVFLACAGNEYAGSVSSMRCVDAQVCMLRECFLHALVVIHKCSLLENISR